MENRKKDQVDYHSAFVGSMGILLWPYRKNAKISEEIVLRKQGIRVDAMVEWAGKVPEDLPCIFRKFRRKNLFEYKRADSELSENIFAKVLGYGNIYKALETRTDRRDFDDITATIYRHSRPIRLFRKLKSRGVNVENPYKGVYYIEDAALFPVQVLVGRELDEDIYAVLRVLIRNAEAEDVRRFYEQSKMVEDESYQEYVDKVMQASVPINEEYTSVFQRRIGKWVRN